MMNSIQLLSILSYFIYCSKIIVNCDKYEYDPDHLYFAQKETKGRHKSHRGKHISIYFNRPSKKITPKIKERTLYDFEYTSSINKHKFHQARIPSSSKTAMDYSLITKNASKHSLPDLESKPIHESSLKQIERQPTSIHSTRTSDSSLPNYSNA